MKYSNTIKWLNDNKVSYEIQKDETIHVTGFISIAKGEVTLDGVTDATAISPLDNATLNAPLLTTADYIRLYKNAILNAPLLTTADVIYLFNNTALNAPLLTTTTGYIDLYDNATLTAPLLTTAGYISLYNNATLNAPLLTTGYIYLRGNAALNAPLLDFDTDKYKSFDGISGIIQSTKTKNGYTIHSCKRPKFKDCKLVGEKFYVATDGKNNAHGETVKEAIEELTFKNESRDTSKYKNMPLDTVKTPDEWAYIYRVITGACKLGTEMFMNNQELKEKYTLEEILEYTENAYGADTFKQCVIN